ncbi:uncharacterized protein LOC110717242 [Chenopodium quinoa]|uniref:uncharacterized protein LOC110717242 n=1 Tax=Chenopodium quinoa TaxID=63459 RepID=UPI000B7967D2|nr:uncharacterized protein LOC110717242 [Chenopodium quinoa]
MMNNGIGMMSASSSTSGGVSSINNNNTQSSLKNYFKTPEGRYKLQYEKSHPSSLISWKYRFPDAKDGHDLLIRLNSGDVYSVSLRQQLQDMGKKLVGTHHHNKGAPVNERY